MDMMIEAMKVVYTKSRSGHSRSSFFSKTSGSLPRGSQYGFLGSPNLSAHSAQSHLSAQSHPSSHSAQSPTSPPGSDFEQPVKEALDFNVSYSVKVQKHIN